jgi:integrase
LNQDLCPRAIWIPLREEAKHQGEQLTTYSFLHRYATWMYAGWLSVAEISVAMGHTIEGHLKSSPRFKLDASAANDAAVNS